MSAKGKHIIGLTGGIGSGKSTATRYLRSLGAATFDADGISRALLDVDGGCYDAVLSAFGEGVRRADGTIDRKALAGIVFSDEAALDQLNGIVHPAVCGKLLQNARSVLAERPDALVILDVPLLFECGLSRDTDENLLVYANDDVRIARVTARDGLTEAQVRARMDAQMPQEEKRRLADVVIDNSTTLSALYAQLDAWYALTAGVRGTEA